MALFDIFDVFDENFTSKGFGVYADSADINNDYIIENKSSMTLNKRNLQIAENDFLVNRGNKEIWRVVNVSEYINLQLYTGFDVINFPIYLASATMVSSDIENSIGDYISDYWNSNSDPLIDVPIAIVTTSTTDGSLTFLGQTELDLRDVAEATFSKYNMTIDLLFNGTGITVTIGVNSNALTFNLTHPSVNNFTIDVSDISYNKLTLYDVDNTLEETYYLLTDNTVTTDENDTNRVTPVYAEIMEVSASDFNSDTAEQSLQGQLSNNEITVTAQPDTAWSELEMGDSVTLIYEDLIIASQMTGYETTDGQSLKYKFGIARNRLTDKLRRR